jgi:heat shock protein HslJ
MRVRALFPVLIAVAWIAAACSAHGPKPVTSSAASPSAPPAGSLEGSRWLLTDLGGREVIDQVEASLTFPEPGKAAGNGSCNQFSGPVTITGTAITFGPLAATRMACVPNVNDQEAAYLKALQDAERFERDELFLTIHYKGGAKPLKFILASRP